MNMSIINNYVLYNMIQQAIYKYDKCTLIIECMLLFLVFIKNKYILEI